MADERLLAAAQLLQNHYGRLDLDNYRADWPGVLRFILERTLPRAKVRLAWQEVQANDWLMSPEDVAAGSRADLLACLEEYGASPKLVALLHQAAIEWQRKHGAEPDLTEILSESDESDNQELSSPQSVVQKRIQCVIYGKRDFPVTAAIWRLACRHRWLSWHDDPSLAPEFFNQGTIDAPFDMGNFVEWLIHVGEDFCGPKPKCEACPLLPLLRADGICEMDE